MDFDRYIAPLCCAAPRHFPDPTVTAYLVAVHSLAALLRIPDIDRSYAHCNLILRTVQLDFSSLFWSTQSKVLQLNIRLRETDHREDFVGQCVHFLCAKCGTWVPDHQFELHLPLRQLIQFDDAPPALKHRVPDSSHHCSIAFQLENSRVENNYWFVHHLSKPDWPLGLSPLQLHYHALCAAPARTKLDVLQTGNGCIGCQLRLLVFVKILPLSRAPAHPPLLCRCLANCRPGQVTTG